MDTMPTEPPAPAEPSASRSRRPGRLVWLSVAAVLVVVAIVALVVDRPSSTPVAKLGSGTNQGGAAPLLPGQMKVPTASIPLTDGSSVTLQSLHGHTVVVNFWYATCAPCRTEMPHLQALHQQLGSDVVFLGIDSGDPKPLAVSTASHFGVHYPIGLDPNEKVVRSVGTIGFPTTLVISPSGALVYSHIGAVDIDELKSQIEVADR
jgi:thiol-disulfide isomerase/thioredoxin